MVVLEGGLVGGVEPETDDGFVVQYQCVVDQDRVHCHIDLLRDEEVRRQEDAAVVGDATVEYI
jgi:hypothetical protein